MSAVFVTGATGTVGEAVVRCLLQRGEQVIAGVRDAASAARLPDGVEPRQFDFDWSRELQEAALSGAGQLFLMRPPALADVERHLFPTIDAARALGMRQVVFLSLQGVQANRATPHHAVETYLRAQRAPYTSLRPNFFMQNLTTTYASPIRERSEIFVPAGRSRTAFVDARDIGAVAAAVFASPKHVGRAYTLSGERSHTYADVARIMSRELDRTITYARPSEDEYLAALAAQGAPEDYLAVQKMIHRVVRWNVSALPGRTIRRITGAPATSLEQFVRDHSHVWESGG